MTEGYVCVQFLHTYWTVSDLQGLKSKEKTKTVAKATSITVLGSDHVNNEMRQSGSRIGKDDQEIKVLLFIDNPKSNIKLPA